MVRHGQHRSRRPLRRRFAACGRRPRTPAALVLAAALALGCGAGDESGPARPAEAPLPHFVDMFDNSFSPQIIHIEPGDTIRFRNKGRNIHNAIADDGSWSTADTFGTLVMEAGDQTDVTFEEDGVYPYFCTYHGSPGKGMWGTAVVGDAEFDPSTRGVLEAVAEPTGIVRGVPSDYPTIQSAVDASAPGDMVLIAPGIYREEVVITTPSLVIRGESRNEVIIDGEHVRGNGVLALADGIAIENMTARNAVSNGFFWTSVTGYRGSWLTAYNNGLYGIYAFDSTDGLFEHSYASGSPDSGFYIGQCRPCYAVIRDIVAEYNAVGYSGTNASEELVIASSVWRHNMTGLLPNTLDSEALPPQGGIHIVANLVVNNADHAAAANQMMYPVFGNGILVTGGNANLIERNLVLGHRGYGIAVAPAYQVNAWRGDDNVIRGNTVHNSGLADLAALAPLTRGNCFEGNDFDTSNPPGIEVFQGCSGPRLPLGYPLSAALGAAKRVMMAESGDYPHGDHKTRPVPPPQPEMPAARTAPPRLARNVYAQLDFDPASAQLPAQASRYLADRGPSLYSPIWSPAERLVSFLPLILYAWWTAWALLSLRRSAGSARLLWGLAIVALPFAGGGARLVADAGRGRRLARAGLLLLSLLFYVSLLLATGAAAPT